MDWIDKNKPIVIVAIVCLIIIQIALCFALSAKQPTPQLEPTIVVANTLTEEQYIDKYNRWNTKGYHIMSVIVDILQGKSVSDKLAADTGADLSILKADVDTTIPPPKYAEVHAHYKQAIQDVYDATLAVAHGRTKESAAKFNHATAELDVVKSLMNSI